MTSFSSKKREARIGKTIYEEEKLSADRGIYCLMDDRDRVRGRVWCSRPVGEQRPIHFLTIPPCPHDPT